MSPAERRLQRQRILESFDLNRAGVVLTALTLVLLGGGVLAALAVILGKL
jgi:hypothetical protein